MTPPVVGSTSGFDIRPHRPLPVTVVLFLLVVTAAAGFAHLFRELSREVLDLLVGDPNQPAAADMLSSIVLFIIVFATVMVAAVIGSRIDERAGANVGVEAVGASARGEGRRISMPATLGRSSATWIVSTGMVSIGRESAIIETGGAIGATAGRWFRGRGDAMSAAGIASAFAAAYHAPVAALFYVEEHLGVRRSRRAITFTVAAAALGHVVSIRLFGGHPIFPKATGSMITTAMLSLIALVPAVIAARLFLQLRTQLKAVAIAGRLGLPRIAVQIVFALTAAAAITVMPLAAGNGMEAIRGISPAEAIDAVPIALIIALSLGKLIGTTAAIGAGAPGGTLTPTISIASGTGVLALFALSAGGVAIDRPWDVMVILMSVGVAVGLRSPLMGVFLMPEMLGQYELVPVAAIVVLAAVAIDRVLDRVVRSIGQRSPRGVYDEDA